MIHQNCEKRASVYLSLLLSAEVYFQCFTQWRKVKQVPKIVMCVMRALTQCLGEAKKP